MFAALAIVLSFVSMTVSSLPQEIINLPAVAPANISISNATETVRTLRTQYINNTLVSPEVPGSNATEQFVIPTTFNSELGSCGLPVSFNQSTIPMVAMGIEDMAQIGFKSQQCGRCVRIQNKLTIITTVSSMCGEACVPGTIQLNEPLARQLNGGEPINFKFPVKWEFVPCPAYVDTRMTETATGLAVPNTAPDANTTDATIQQMMVVAKEMSIDVMQTCEGKKVVIPGAIKTPTDAKLVYALPSEGIQIYKCTNSNWTLFDAAATLQRDCKTKATIVSHNFYLPGAAPIPSFYEIGSFTGFQGNVSAKSAVEGSIPELLLTLKKNREGDAPGRYDMSKIRFVQRLAPEGGVAPPTSECVAEKEGELRAVAFRSLYTFYL